MVHIVSCEKLEFEFGRLHRSPALPLQAYICVFGKS